MKTSLQLTAPVHEASGINYNKPNMSVPEAAQFLGIGCRTLRELIARQEIRHVRIGRRVLIRKQDCEAFMEENIVQGGRSL
ncbi:MAG: helix-turn-helix domain-containing protein [Verrucomicrobia bacterium]|nr:helix-turn-helix domain-containing protein [Verrucomicrobiota bacterium]